MVRSRVYAVNIKGARAQNESWFHRGLYTRSALWGVACASSGQVLCKVLQLSWPGVHE